MTAACVAPPHPGLSASIYAENELHRGLPILKPGPEKRCVGRQPRADRHPLTTHHQCQPSGARQSHAISNASSWLAVS